MVTIKRKISKKRYVLVFILTAIIFSIGIFVGSKFTSYVVLDIEMSQEALKNQISGVDLKNEILKKVDICSLSWESLWKDKVELGNSVEMLERRLGKNDPQVLFLKTNYQLVQVRTWLLLKDIKERCTTDTKIILFFYTNKKDDQKGDPELSEAQGVVLNALYKKYGSKVSIFSFDINIKNPAVETLIDIYGITSAPTIVIEDKTYLGFKSRFEIEEYLFN